MEMKYNKKNNAYFLYEMLIRSYIDVYNKSIPKRELVLKVIYEFFKNSSPLGVEKNLYEQILGLVDRDLTDEEKKYVLRRCRDEYGVLQANSSTRTLKEGVIKKASAVLSNHDFLNYKIDNYVLLANIYHYFNTKDFGFALEIEKKILEGLKEEKNKKSPAEDTNKLLELKKLEGISATEDVLVMSALLKEANSGFFLFLYDKIQEYKDILLQHSVCSECEVCDVEMKTGILKCYHRLEEIKNRELREEDLLFLSDVSSLVEELRNKGA